jgi:ferrochelatase
MKTGILLFNLGGPWTLKDVKPFLYELFSDEDILIDMPGWLRKTLAFVISQTKGGNSIKQYAKIGGGSPQLKWTQAQAALLKSKLSQNVQIEIGMRASSPKIKAAIESFKRSEIDRLLVLPLFPHYSTTTTGSCYKELYRQLKAQNFSPESIHVRNWPEHPKYISLLITTLKETLAQSDPNLKTHLLISAHSLPLKIVEKGDPYPQDVARTIGMLKSELESLQRTQNFTWSLCYQSRNGPIPWLKPYTEDEIKRLAKEGFQQLLIMPISFVSDHIETLSELDIDYKELAVEHGVTSYLRTRSFNDDPVFIDMLSEIVNEHLNRP